MPNQVTVQAPTLELAFARAEEKVHAEVYARWTSEDPSDLPSGPIELALYSVARTMYMHAYEGTAGDIEWTFFVGYRP